MASRTQRPALLSREYLPVRANILEIASSLDRIQRASAADTSEPEWKQLQAGIKLLLDEEADRAENVQMLFSQPYDQQWRKTLDV